MTEFNQMQSIKRQMFALRNGIIADTLRKAGARYRTIFGLNIPQVQEIAASLSPERQLAQSLWDDKRTRESQLLAPMVFPREEMDKSTAMKWMGEATEVEVIDNLCHKLLRYLPFAWELSRELADSDKEMERYGAVRLMWNLVNQLPEEILPYAEREAGRKCRLTQRVAMGLAEECKFFLGIEE